MFETILRYPAVLRRHREGPLAEERERYLGRLVAQGAANGTLLGRARMTLCVAREIERWPADYCFAEREIGDLAVAWALRRTTDGHAGAPRWPEAAFRFTATDFLRAIGRLQPRPVVVGRYDREVDDFVAARREDRWLSEATCHSGRWQVKRFLLYLEQRSIALGDVEPGHVDTFFQIMAARWRRTSLHSSAAMLRAWFTHCEARGWVKPGIAATVLLPRIYREEALPLGPTWGAVGRMLADVAGSEPAQLRDHAILRLLSVYGIRSGEVRRLEIDDLDWHRGRIRIVRSKSGREELLPLEPSVGNSIADYLRQGRPSSPSRIIFLTLRAPHRPITAGGLYDVVRRHLPVSDSPAGGRGPHGLRHACARHLVEAGRSFKEVGDYLGHRSPDSTRVYAKVDLTSLRRVALDDLGGLV